MVKHEMLVGIDKAKVLFLVEDRTRLVDVTRRRIGLSTVRAVRVLMLASHCAGGLDICCVE